MTLLRLPRTIELALRKVRADAPAQMTSFLTRQTIAYRHKQQQSEYRVHQFLRGVASYAASLYTGNSLTSTVELCHRLLPKLQEDSKEGAEHHQRGVAHNSLAELLAKLLAVLFAKLLAALLCFGRRGGLH